MTRQEFINWLIPKTKNLPVLQSLTIAQICLESAFGKKHFHNNYLGIKCHKGVKCRNAKTKEYINGNYKDYKLAFAVYENIDDCILDYVNILSRKRYRAVREAKNYIEATEQIRLCGYATSPSYSNSLRKLIEKYHLNDLDVNMTCEDLDSDFFRYNDNLTDNFKYGEFWSGDRKFGKKSIEPPHEYFEYIMACAEQLQIVRDILNGRADLKGRYLQYRLFPSREFKIQITSAYRTPDWNRHEKGSKNSLHLKGLAVDTRAIGLPLFIYYSYLLKYTKFNQYGYYRWKNFIHSGLMNDFVIFKY